MNRVSTRFKRQSINYELRISNYLLKCIAYDLFLAITFQYDRSFGFHFFDSYG
ncbi:MULTISPECIES: hypothetical protein [unclassified Tolypothrix]|uniref:hypothetical protein n=1 Tax=unclassified Tolypothrix TaxID=2649714 RepID=UPI000A596C67|nr:MULTISPECIES: hypothetical protein [unclassified Tolypothrix]MBE9088078.1 hypothetical protein [Tolypothrix sp. LEGE 11397]UYD30246.1 hypothetical protein HGR01_33315 [Tolypothrix sp. PCC 7712]